MLELGFDKNQLATVAQDYGLRLVLLYGSRAEGRARPDSDLDIAMMGCPNERFWSCYDAMGKVFFRVSLNLDLVRLESADGQSTRLETMRGGRMVGEIGFFTGRDRSAAVVTDEASTLYRLSRHTLQDMEHNDPRAARALYLGIIRLLSDRVLRLNDALQALRV